VTGAPAGHTDATMITRILKRAAAGRVAKQVPLFKVVSIAQIGMLARKHVQNLTPAERRRLFELVRDSRHLSDADRTELRALTAKLDPRAFAGAAADHLSPFPLPNRLTGVKAKRT
jgi:tellurite resistance protein